MACIHKETFDIYHNDQIIVPDGYFEIDEEIAPAIQVLNRKGYITEYCCAGHPLTDWLMRSSKAEYEKSNVEPDSYILFKEGILLPTLPPGFFNDSSGMRLVIRKSHRYSTYADNTFFGMSKHIVETMEQLYEWALNLPDFTS